jgi:hypothetical protein
MALVYTNAELLMKQGSLILTSATVKVMLVNNTYTPNQDDVNVSALSSAELSGTGYVGGFAGAGRKTLGSKSFAADNANNQVTFAGANMTWTAINAGTAQAAVLIKENTTDADSILIAYLDAASPYVTNGGDMTLAFTGGFPFVTTT